MPGDLSYIDELLTARVVEHEGNVRAVIAGYASDGQQERPALRYVAASLVGEPQEHGMIQSTPTTLRELHDSLKSAGLDLFEELHARLDSWRGSEDLAQLLDLELLLIVALPKTRDERARSKRRMSGRSCAKRARAGWAKGWESGRPTVGTSAFCSGPRTWSYGARMYRSCH